MDNAAVIERFYSAFAEVDHKTMATCYSPNIVFHDEVFDLKGDKASAMWRMLCTRAEDFQLTYSQVKASGNSGSARWEAKYLFSTTGRHVHNIIDAQFEFDDTGLIVKHTDSFPFYRWTRQALGLPGVLLGWTPMIRNKVRKTANKQLDRFIEKEKQAAA